MNTSLSCLHGLRSFIWASPERNSYNGFPTAYFLLEHHEELKLYGTLKPTKEISTHGDLKSCSDHRSPWLKFRVTLHKKISPRMLPRHILSNLKMEASATSYLSPVSTGSVTHSSSSMFHTTTDPPQIATGSTWKIKISHWTFYLSWSKSKKPHPWIGVPWWNKFRESCM